MSSYCSSRRILVILGTFFGCGLLLFCGYWSAKRYLTDLVVSAVRDELRTSCAECDLIFDQVTLSLFLSEVRAKHTRLLRNGKVEATVGDIVTSFSLKKLREGEISLSLVALSDVDVTAWGPSSALFRFIEYLSESTPSENPPLLKVRLEQLSVTNAVLKNSFTSTDVIAHGVRVSMGRNEKDFFRIAVAAEAVDLIRHPRMDPETIALGALKAVLSTTDHLLMVNHINLAKGGATAQYKGSIDPKNHAALAGTVDGILSLEELELGDWISGKVHFHTDVTGRIKEPRCEGTITSSSTGVKIAVAGSSVEFASIEGNVSTGFKDDASYLFLKALRGKGVGTSLEAPSSFALTEDAMEGEFTVFLETLELLGQKLYDVSATVRVLDELLKVEFESREARVATAKFTDISGDLSFQNEVLSFEAISRPPDPQKSGELVASGVLNLDPATPEDSRLTLTIRAQEFPFLFTTSQVLRATGEVSGKGGAALGKLTLAGEVLVDGEQLREVLPATVKVLLNEGVFTAQGVDPSKKIRGEFRYLVDNRELTTLKVEVDDHVLSRGRAAGLCARLSGNLDYSFPGVNLNDGQGRVTLGPTQFGCSPTVRVAAPGPLPIQNGEILLDGVVLESSPTALVLTGGFHLERGFRLQADGELQLASIAPLVPQLDSVTGVLAVKAAVRGIPTAPLFEGTGALRDVTIVAGDAGIEIKNLNGPLRFDAEALFAESIAGEVNSGTVSFNGQLPWHSLQDGNLRVDFKKVFLQPTRSATVETDGDLVLSLDPQGHPKIVGQVDIRSAEFEQTITLASVLKELIALLIWDAPTPESATQFAGVETEIALDVKIAAPKNLVIQTNWLQSELKGDIRVTGTLAEPQVVGRLEVVSGSFGLRHRTFDLTAATIEFLGNRSLPRIDMVSESTIRTRQGETVAVFLELKGPINAPEVTLTSDRGFSQQELLQLLALGGGAGGGTGGDAPLSLGLGFEYQDISVGRRNTTFFLENVVYNLTKIDSVSLEPSFNPATGSLDPALFAQKRLSDDLVVNANRVFSDTFSQSELSLSWKLSPFLSLNGGLRSLVGQNNAAPEGNLRFTILAPERRQLALDMQGNWHLSEDEIIKAGRLDEGTRLYVVELPLRARAIEKLYQDAGFLDAQVEMQCKDEGKEDRVRSQAQCQELKVKVTEGKRKELRELLVQGSLPPSLPEEEFKKALLARTFASKSYRQSVELEALRMLRKLGFISTRVSTHYDSPVNSATAALVVTVTIGTPVSFFFLGNTEFTDDELLETINLFERSHPFGTNAITLLSESVKRLYRENGFLNIALNVSEQFDEAEQRRTYSVHVQEGPRIKVVGVTILGQHIVTQEELHDELERLNGAEATYLVFHPHRAVEEEITHSQSMIEAAYRELGFTEVKVASQVKPEGNDTVSIELKIAEGEQAVVRDLMVEGMPILDSLFEYPVAPFSVVKINRLTESLARRLKEAGYLRPSISVDFVATENTGVVMVTPGTRTVVDKVVIEGSSKTDEALILETIALPVNAPWDEALLREAKKRLFKLGLFSRIGMAPEDGAIDSPKETLLISIKERALRSLEAGTGLNSEFGAHFFTEAIERGLFADGRTLSLKADLYYDPRIGDISRGSTNLVFSTPRFLQTDLNWVEDLSFQRLVTFNQEYNLSRTSLLSYLTGNEGTHLSYYFGHSLLLDQISDVSKDSILSSLDEGATKTSAIVGRLALDERDNPLLPSHGFLLSLDSRIADQILASDANYGAADMKVSFVHTFGGALRRFSLSGSSRLGLAKGFGGTPELPITQRFYLGGRQTIRGFRENSLGPKGINGNVIGGDILQANSVETAYRFSDNASFHIFMDAGNVFLRSQDVRLDHQRVSSGVGTRYLSPIGPIGFDVGSPLDRKDDEPALRVHFAIGSRF